MKKITKEKIAEWEMGAYAIFSFIGIGILLVLLLYMMFSKHYFESNIMPS